MTYTACDAPPSTESCSVCDRCGSIVHVQGKARHDAWHDFLESGLVGLAADVAGLSNRPAP